MEKSRRNDIADLVQKILAGKHKCGLAGDSAIKDLWDENGELHDELTALRAEVGSLKKRGILARSRVEGNRRGQRA